MSAPNLAALNAAAAVAIPIADATATSGSTTHLDEEASQPSTCFGRCWLTMKRSEPMALASPGAVVTVIGTVYSLFESNIPLLIISGTGLVFQAILCVRARTWELKAEIGEDVRNINAVAVPALTANARGFQEADRRTGELTVVVQKAEEEAKAQASKQMGDLNAASTRVAVDLQAIEALQQEAADLRNKLAARDKALGEEKNAKEELAKEMSKVTGELESLKKEKSAFEDQQRQYQEKIAGLQKSIDDVRSQLGAEQSRLDAQAQERAAALKKEEELLSSTLQRIQQKNEEEAATVRRLQDLEKQIEAKTQELKKYDDLKDLVEDPETLKQFNDFLTQKVDAIGGGAGTGAEEAGGGAAAAAQALAKAPTKGASS